MQLSGDIERLAQLIAAKTGKTPEAVVKEAVEARAAEAGVAPRTHRRSPDEIKASIDAIMARVAALPVLDTRSDDEILGYNALGVPE